jgi:hypothetical protein
MSVNVIGQLARIATYALHHMWNCIHMQLMQLSYNYVEGSYLSNSKNWSTFQTTPLTQNEV